MIHVRPTFTAVYSLKSPHKRNGKIRTCYRQAPKTVSTMQQAMCWYFDTIHNKGKGNKDFIEMREGC